MKTHWCLLKLSPGNKIRTDGDWRTDTHTDVQRETIIPRHYRVAGLKMQNMQFYSEINSGASKVVLPNILQLQGLVPLL